jgi:hypothetical protein
LLQLITAHQYDFGIFKFRELPGNGLAYCPGSSRDQKNSGMLLCRLEFITVIAIHSIHHRYYERGCFWDDKIYIP